MQHGGIRHGIQIFRRCQPQDKGLVDGERVKHPQGLVRQRDDVDAERRYGAMDKSEAKRLRELEKENARLEKATRPPHRGGVVASLDNDILREVARGKF